jgi:hypothetical protein
MLALAAGYASAAESKIRMSMVGPNYDHFTRTVVWDGDPASSRIVSNLLSARAEFGLAKGMTFSLSAGLSLTDFKDLAFTNLPISLEYGAAPMTGIVLGGEFEAPLSKFGDFEIRAAGRFVSSFGMSKTWPLEGFAVEGQAKGRVNWMEASAGPRVAYLFFGKFVPYVEVSARWLTAGFRMDETLGDLQDSEKKRVKGDFAIGISLGGEGRVSDRLFVRAKAGFIPFSGGVDALASIGVSYVF